jgi:hypothetical protein
MSTEWGGLSPDTFTPLSVEADESEAVEVEEAPGAWPEEMETAFYAESSMTIPGESEPGANCGEWRPQEFCKACGEPSFGPSRCEQRGCPDCWSKWSRNRTENIVVRLGAARHAADEAQAKRAVHAVASPPEGEIRTLTDVQQGFRDAYDLAQKRGVRGGVCIFHGFRVREAVKREFRAEDPDCGIWAWIRGREEDWRTMTYWSPHFHVLGLARDVEADTGDSGDVWRFRRIRSLERFSLTGEDGYDDMAGATRYLLSHLTFEGDASTDSVRWFGSLATASFSPSEALSEGALSAIERKAAEVVGGGDGRGDEADDEQGEDCECGECGACSMAPIWEAGSALMDKSWCERIGREQQRRLSAAFEWAIGERQPPPGLKRPTTEQEAREAFESVL